MIDNEDENLSNGQETDDFTVPSANREVRDRATRLSLAVKEAGGPRAVARASGVPYGTISAHIAGREMKVSTLIALATALRVDLKWLATGQDSPPPPEVPSPATPSAAGLTGKVDNERLGLCAAAATQAVMQSGFEPPADELGELITRIYDLLSVSNDPHEASGQITAMLRSVIIGRGRSRETGKKNLGK